MNATHIKPFELHHVSENALNNEHITSQRLISVPEFLNFDPVCMYEGQKCNASSVVTVSETDTETKVFCKNRPSPKPRFFSAIIDGFWAHLHAKII